MWIIAGSVAGLLTFFDLDRTFYIPSKIGQKWQFYIWYWGFVLANGLLAVALYFALEGNSALTEEFSALNNLPLWLRSFLIGVSYLAIIRLKFATIKIGEQEVPFGIEAFYEAAKESVYRNINRIAKIARAEEAINLTKKHDLDTLVALANLSITQDVLLAPEEKEAATQWIKQIKENEDSNDLEKQMLLANFILSGRI
ncbi:MAG: hypothetical protein F6K41_42650 [Symploca sp. SIO3E6]|nr:hypothetical protein [Caldora sp. SIO3E6]